MDKAHLSTKMDRVVNPLTETEFSYISC
jgi:hypothetical protein